MTLEEKLRMAEALKDLGVDVLEAGFAIASQGDFDSVQAISKRFSKDGPVVASLSRAAQTDILRSAEALKPAARPRIHIVLATSDLHMRVKLRMSREEVLEAAAATRTSCAAAPRPRSAPARPRSTSPTPWATPCPRTWSASSRTCARACRASRWWSFPRTTTTT
jgi:hypothetical protein